MTTADTTMSADWAEKRDSKMGPQSVIVRLISDIGGKQNNGMVVDVKQDNYMYS